MIGGPAQAGKLDAATGTVYSQLGFSSAAERNASTQVSDSTAVDEETKNRRQSSKRLAAGILASAAAVASLVVLCRGSRGSARGQLRHNAGASIEQLEKASPTSSEVFKGPGKCGKFEHGLNYVLWGAQWGASLDHIPTADMCCAMCHGVEQCKAWTWIEDAGLDGNPSQCWLKGRQPDEKEPKLGYISGVPPPRPHLPPGLWTSQARVTNDEDIDKIQNHTCARVEYDMDYLSGELVVAVPGMFSPGQCCDECHAVAECNAWTWGKSSATDRNNTVCYLKTAAPNSSSQKSVSHGIVSGIPGHHPSKRNVTAKGLMKSVVVKKPGSLFCFSLMMPHSYEQELVKTQYAVGASIFACDTAALYSNLSIFIAPGITTRVVPSQLTCKMGGEFGTALNTWIFIKVWKKVIDDRFWLYHDWTVKVDPDSVFMPQRLVKILKEHKGAGYINNCKYGLHGPIEVLGRSGMAALAADYAKSFDGNAPKECVENLHFEMWGEDMFLDQCLAKVLKVDRQMDDRLMCEAHCDCPDWFWCKNGTDRVIFHPFKQKDLYRQCLANALDMSGDLPSPNNRPPHQVARLAGDLPSPKNRSPHQVARLAGDLPSPNNRSSHQVAWLAGDLPSPNNRSSHQVVIRQK